MTGAFSHTGRHIAANLLALGRGVRTLTRDPGRQTSSGDGIEAHRLSFDRPDDLARAMDGADTLYNTYWQRFAHGQATFDQAVRNTETLVAAAARAGVRRIVQISITHADPRSSLPYFRGKGLAEDAVRGAGLGYGIVRPAVLFGPRGIVLEQVAWLCRHLPAFAVFGTGQYPVQPIHVEDLAALAVRAGRAETDSVVDAVGPERYTFEQLVRAVGAAVGRTPPIVHLPPRAVAWAGAVGGWVLGDILISWDEIAGIMNGYFASDGPATGTVRLGGWLAEHGRSLGTGAYPSELRRHYRLEFRGRKATR